MTSAPFQVGDRVLLTGLGCNRPASELMAVWEVVQFRGNQVVVKLAENQTVQELEVTGDRTFPATWLVLYRPAEEDEEF